jgi:hypothetical protein
MFLLRTDAGEVFRHDGSLTAAHTARRAVREHDCVL